HLHLPDVHDAQPLGFGVQPTAHRHLREGEALVAPRATKAGIARVLFATAHAAKERLKGQINADGNVLQDLRLHPSQARSLSLKRWQCPMLVIQAYRFLALLPGIAPFSKHMIVQPTTFCTLLLKQSLLLLIRVQSVLACFTHAIILT